MNTQANQKNLAVLEVKDLKTYFYHNNKVNRALEGVSFTLHRGRILGVVGESGCGKSVTAASIMQLIPELARIEAGQIIYRNEAGEHHLENYCRGSKQMQLLRGKEIAMIFQDPIVSLNPVYTIGFQIAEMLRLHSEISKKEALTKAIELLGEMGIPSPELRVNDYPHQFSGGMRQRAMIAMAMACEPKVLIADEPTTALDVTTQAQVFDLLLKLRAEKGMATMLITHDMGVIAELADDVAVMYMGYIVETGTAAQVLGDPQHPYTKALLKSIPILGKGHAQQLAPIKGSTPDPYKRPSGCQFAPRCDFARSICARQKPPLVNMGNGRSFICWQAESIYLEQALTLEHSNQEGEA